MSSWIWRKLDPVCTLYFPMKMRGKQRHTKTGRTPLATRIWEAEVIGSIASDAWGERAPYPGYVGISICMWFESLLKKPDTDNVKKSLYDGMQGIIFTNDRNILYEESEQLQCNEFNPEPQAIVEVRFI